MAGCSTFKILDNITFFTSGEALCDPQRLGWRHTRIQSTWIPNLVYSRIEYAVLNQKTRQRFGIFGFVKIRHFSDAFPVLSWLCSATVSLWQPAASDADTESVSRPLFLLCARVLLFQGSRCLCFPCSDVHLVSSSRQWVSAHDDGSCKLVAFHRSMLTTEPLSNPSPEIKNKEIMKH